jgi:hypothetical protein
LAIFASEMIGPNGLRRIVRRIGRHQRDLITVPLVSISPASSFETS